LNRATPDKSNVPVFILAGGLGTRIAEETSLKPKPMVEIGDLPVLVHILRWYYHHGFSDFVICAGYKGWEIKQYFLNYEHRLNDLCIDHRQDSHYPARALGDNSAQERWRVRVIDTGAETMTGGRIARAWDLIARDQQFETCAVTYGDGLSDVDLSLEWEFHRSHGKLGTVLAVHPSARFGELDIGPGGMVEGFLEKPQSRQALVNGGFFFFNQKFREYVDADPACILERKPLEELSRDKQLMTHKHNGFWQPMDTLRDKIALQKLWESGKAPWLPKARK